MMDNVPPNFKKIEEVWIFLICAFLVALSIYAGVLTKQTVKLFSKTELYSLIGNSKDNKTINYLFSKIMGQIEQIKWGHWIFM